MSNPRILVASAGVALVACADPAARTVAPTASPGSDLAAAPIEGAERIPGQYIVVFKPEVQDAPGLTRRLAAEHGATVRFTYGAALKGFAGSLPGQAAAALARNPNVAYVEPDQVMRVVATQEGATWGLDRIDQRDLPLSTTYSYDATGSGVSAYIIDTGILLGHNEFTGRVSTGFDAVTSGGDANDCNGHGTHVAGTVGGTTYGVAKATRLYAVRVLGCNGSGTNSGVIAGVDWVTSNRQLPAVANMSLGGGASTALDDAVRRSIASGVTYALAAGNGDFLGRPQDACAGSPSRVTEGLTVGATDKTDKEASFSNYGTCVDLLAPGVSITSAWYTSTTATNTISGTSMATPHVAGAAALYLQTNVGAAPATVADALTKNASVDKITLHSRSASGGTPNLLLYTGTQASEPPPASTSITLTTSGYKTKGRAYVDLVWSGATTAVDIYRNDSPIAAAESNDGKYTDSLGRVSGTYTYKVCAAGTTTCSNTSSVTF